MRQYSIDNCELTWLGLDFKPGLAAGTSIQEARNAPHFTMKQAGAVKKVTRVFNPDSSGTVTVTVDQEAQLHQDLIALAESERTPAGRNKVANMVLKDLSSGQQFTWRNAFITTQPDEARAVESQTFGWVFGFEDYEVVDVGALSNAVGV